MKRIFLGLTAILLSLVVVPQLSIASPPSPQFPKNSTPTKAPKANSIADLSASTTTNYNHGPRAGFMRGGKDVQSEILMGPGANFRFYFVDRQWIDIPLKDSALKVTLKGPAGSKSELSCKLGVECYTCALDKGLTFTIGDLVEVVFSQQGEPRVDYTFEYKFPFQPS